MKWNKSGTEPGKSKLMVLGALALGTLMGCGQVSYFTVAVEVKDAPGRDKNKLSQVLSVEVIATGATSEETSFLLTNFPRPQSYNYQTQSDGQLLLARFQYGTTKESGNVDFDVYLRNGTNGPDGVIGNGKAGGNIKAGGNQDVTVMVTPTNFL
jgi:hypothetical protein